jgi:hypothetical protein
MKPVKAFAWPLATALSLGITACQTTRTDNYGARMAQSVASSPINQTLEIRAADLAYQPLVLNVPKPGRPTPG